MMVEKAAAGGGRRDEGEGAGKDALLIKLQT